MTLHQQRLHATEHIGEGAKTKKFEKWNQVIFHIHTFSFSYGLQYYNNTKQQQENGDEEQQNKLKYDAL